MTDIPDSAFDPTQSGVHESSENVVPAPFITVRQNSGLPASALTPDGKLATGQRFYKVSYKNCQLTKGAEKRILDQENGCSVFAVEKKCWRVSETWWSGPPKTLISTTQDDPDQSKYEDGKPKILNVIFCPQGVATPAPPGNGDQPPVWLPPKTEKWGTGQASTEVEKQPVGEYLIVREVWEELVPPASQRGCIVTAAYKRYWKITKTKLPNGPAEESREAYTPDTVELRTFVVPGCAEKVTRSETAEPLLDDTMAAVSGQNRWTSASTIWVPTPHLLVQFQIADDGLSVNRVKSLIEASLTSIHRVAGSVAEGLVSQIDSAAPADIPPESTEILSGK